VHHGLILFGWHWFSILARDIQPPAETALWPLFVTFAFPVPACLTSLGCNGSTLTALRALA
jgi:hypothetical protein